MITINVLLWIHIVAMVGALGVLIAIQWGLAVPVRDSVEGSGKAGKLAAALLGFGFLAGLVLFFLEIKADMLGDSAHALIGTKILILVASGALLGMAAGKLKKGEAGPANVFRMLTILLLVIASLLGVLV